MNIDRYESITGEELPRKMSRIKNPVRLSLKEFWAIEKGDGISSWGSVVNNPCIVYQAKDGRFIEEYNPTGLPSIWIEEAAQ